MLPAWLVIAFVFLLPALEALAFIGFGLTARSRLSWAASQPGAAPCRCGQSSWQRWPWPSTRLAT